MEFWSDLSYTTKFSGIAFVATFILGFISMGILGALLYYPVSIVLRAYPWIDNLYGDWMWPATIMIGMGWSFDYLSSVIVLRFIYGLILWSWAAFMWWYVIRNNAT